MDAYSFSGGGTISCFSIARDTLSGENSPALGINVEGQVIAWSTTPYWQFHAFLYEHGPMHVIHPVGGTTSQAWAVNNREQVAGFMGEQS